MVDLAKRLHDIGYKIVATTAPRGAGSGRRTNAASEEDAAKGIPICLTLATAKWRW
jgi:hypothetical protein